MSYIIILFIIILCNCLHRVDSNFDNIYNEHKKNSRADRIFNKYIWEISRRHFIDKNLMAIVIIQDKNYGITNYFSSVVIQICENISIALSNVLLWNGTGKGMNIVPKLWISPFDKLRWPIPMAIFFIVSNLDSLQYFPGNMHFQYQVDDRLILLIDLRRQKKVLKAQLIDEISKLNEFLETNRIYSKLITFVFGMEDIGLDCFIYAPFENSSLRMYSMQSSNINPSKAFGSIKSGGMFIKIKGPINDRQKAVLQVWSKPLNFTYFLSSTSTNYSFIFDMSESFYLANYKEFMQIKYPRIDPAVSFGQLCFIVPKAPQRDTWQAPLRSLSLEGWYCFLATYLASAAFWTILHKKWSHPYTLWAEILGYLFTVPQMRMPQVISNAHRLFLSYLLLTSIIINNAIQAGMFQYLYNPGWLPNINSLKDLYLSRLPIVDSYNASNIDILEPNSIFALLQKKMIPAMENFTWKDVSTLKVTTEMTWYRAWFLKTYNPEASRLIHLVPECIFSKPIYYYTEQEYPMVSDLSKYLYRLNEGGLLRQWEHADKFKELLKLKMSSEGRRYSIIQSSETKESQILNQKDLIMAFGLLGLGFFFSLIILLIENIVFKYNFNPIHMDFIFKAAIFVFTLL